MTEECAGVYSFDLFTSEFCHMFHKDMKLFEASDLPKHRPNSMNNYGLVLNDIGMEMMISKLLQQYIQPFVKFLLPQATSGYPVDHHHSFIVEYKEGADLSLDMHTDDSDVTLNINICDSFTGAGLSFCGLYGAVDRRILNRQYSHKLGRAVIHAGLHTHGADTLETGERFVCHDSIAQVTIFHLPHRSNVIVWCRSSQYRRSAAYQARFESPTLTEYEPEQRCLSRTHDGDYQHWMDHFSAPSSSK